MGDGSYLVAGRHSIARLGTIADRRRCRRPGGDWGERRRCRRRCGAGEPCCRNGIQLCRNGIQRCFGDPVVHRFPKQHPGQPPRGAASGWAQGPESGCITADDVEDDRADRDSCCGHDRRREDARGRDEIEDKEDLYRAGEQGTQCD